MGHRKLPKRCVVVIVLVVVVVVVVVDDDDVVTGLRVGRPRNIYSIPGKG